MPTGELVSAQQLLRSMEAAREATMGSTMAADARCRPAIQAVDIVPCSGITRHRRIWCGC